MVVELPSDDDTSFELTPGYKAYVKSRAPLRESREWSNQ
jgi:hypothetical protein